MSTLRVSLTALLPCWPPQALLLREGYGALYPLELLAAAPAFFRGIGSRCPHCHPPRLPTVLPGALLQDCALGAHWPECDERGAPWPAGNGKGGPPLEVVRRPAAPFGNRTAMAGALAYSSCSRDPPQGLQQLTYCPSCPTRCSAQRIAAEETVILLTLSLSITIDTPTEGRGGSGASRGALCARGMCVLGADVHACVRVPH